MAPRKASAAARKRPSHLTLVTPPSPEVAASSAPAPADRWSIYQRAIFREVAEGVGHLLVKARAGTGKTTTIVEALRHVPANKSSLLVAFNKSIAAELERRAPEGVMVRTLHSFGFAALRNAFRTRLEEGKTDRIARRIFGDSLKGAALSNLAKLVSRAKATLAETDEDLDRAIDDLGLQVPDRERPELVERAAAVLSECYRDTASCDFDDMIWLPVRHGIRVPTFDVVFVDETQDLNACQIDLALRAVREGGRVVAVGDDRQAIYAFRGADRHAIDRIVRTLDARVLPLSITYRCAKSIVALAQEIVPDYEAAPSAPDGVVRTTNEEKLRAEVTPGDFIISRKNAPLIRMCLRLLGAQKPATIAGRDIGSGLLSLVNAARVDDVMGLLLFVDTWRKQETDRLTARGRDTQPIEDRADCITALCEGAATVEEVRARITALFSDTDDTRRIVCTTVHKAKGLERERCWILADTFTLNGGTEEDNLWYVAVTRAKTELCIAGLRAERKQDKTRSS